MLTAVIPMSPFNMRGSYRVTTSHMLRPPEAALTELPRSDSNWPRNGSMPRPNISTRLDCNTYPKAMMRHRFLTDRDGLRSTMAATATANAHKATKSHPWVNGPSTNS